MESELVAVDVDSGRLEAYLLSVGLELDGPLERHLLTGGKSNLTYTVTSGTRTWVLRRPPLGHVLPSAHQMSREFRVMSALKESNVPVPRTIAFCDDETVIGAEFYLMDFVDGVAYATQRDLDKLDAGQVHAAGLHLVDTLADLHAVDPASVGLENLGRPAGFLQRQMQRWAQQFEHSRHRELDGIDELHSRLESAIPDSSRAAIVHGDFRLDNVLFDGARVAAVIDWEMATLGDPFTDLGLLAVYRHQHLDEGADAQTANPMLTPGFPSWEELLERYRARSTAPVPELDWYAAMASYKLAVILEGIAYRHAKGLTVGEGFTEVADMVPPLVQTGLYHIGVR